MTTRSFLATAVLILAAGQALPAKAGEAAHPGHGDPEVAAAPDTAPPAPAALGAASTLEDLLAWAEAQSPRLEALRRRRAAALESVRLARALPEPQVGLSLGLDPVETRVGPQYGALSLSQTLPGSGKRDARAEVARAAAATTEREYQAERARLDFEIAAAYYDLYLLRRTIRITRDNRDLLVFLEEVLRRSYETGRTVYADLIRAQVEIGRLENDLRSLEDRLLPVRARLNALLHRPADAALPDPVVPEGPLALRPEAELRARLRDDAPDVAVIDALLDRDLRRIESAGTEDRPDWTVSMAWRPTGSARVPGVPDSGDDSLSVGLSVSVPVWRGKYRAAVRRAQEMHGETLARRTALVDGLEDRLAASLYEFRNAEREMDLYRDTLIPKATQSLEATEASVRAGTAGALELVDAQRILLQFQLSYERALTERSRRLAELRRLVGGEVLAGEAGPARISVPGGEA